MNFLINLWSSGMYGEIQWMGEGQVTAAKAKFMTFPVKLWSSGKYGETQWMGEGSAMSWQQQKQNCS